MRHGHITMNCKSTTEGTFACPNCGENFEETGGYWDGCDDPFGGRSWWVECCPNCGNEDYVEGKIFLHKTGVSVANKDHYDGRGNVVIHKGWKYKWEIMKGYQYNEETNLTEGIYNYRKWIPSEWSNESNEVTR